MTPVKYCGTSFFLRELRIIFQGRLLKAFLTSSRITTKRSRLYTSESYTLSA